MTSTPARRWPFLVAAFGLGALLLAAPAEAGQYNTKAVRPVIAARTPERARRAPAPPVQTREPAVTALQLAAQEGMTYSDRSTYVLLEAGTLRLRIYPGSDVTVVAGKEHRVKDPFLRSAGDVILSGRVARFLRRQVGTFRAGEASRRRQVVRTKRYPALPPLPPRHVRPKPAPAPVHVTPARKPALRRRAVAGGDPAWVPQAKERPWKWIVIHHSDDESGNMAKYDDYHRNEKHWENGCGYHFVIGNGSLSGDGEIEMGPRWRPQLQGAHAKVPGNRFNERGIGICLVGDFDAGNHGPSPAQLDALVRLVRWLKARYGIDDADIHGHCDCCSTRCPGRHFPWRTFRKRIR